MGKMESPPQVKKAQLQGDSDALRAMARKGGEHAAITRAFQKERKAENLLEAEIERARLYSLKDGDVLPPDPDIISKLTEQ